MSELPRGWVEAPVSQLLQASIGGVWGKEAGSDEVDAVVIRVADFRDDGSINFDSAPLRSVTARQLTSRELRVGDILLEKSGGGPTKPVGRVVRMRPTSGPVVPTNFVHLLRPNDEFVDSGFLFWWLWRSHSDGTASEFQCATTNIRNLRTQDYLDRRAPLPPLNEQRRIVAAIEEHLSRLDAADASLAGASRRLIPLREHVLAVNGNGWPTSPLRELLREPLRNGHSAKASRDGTVRTLTLTAVTRAQFTDDNTKLTTADSAKVKGLWLEPGDIFIERSNTPELVGTAALFNGPREWAIFPDLLIRVRVGDAVLPAFLEIILKSRPARTYFQRSAQGIAGSMPKIDQGVVERLEVPVPPLEEQRRIVAEIEERLGAIAALRAAIERAQHRGAALRRLILERAFRGELVPQDPSDEPASVLLDRIRAERAAIAVRPVGR